MRFYSELERLEHPEAGKIPKQAWDDYSLFVGELNKLELALMRANSEVTTLDALIDTYPSDSSRKTSAWLAIAFGHPALSDEALLHFMDKFGFTEEEKLVRIAYFGRISLFDCFMSAYSPQVVQAMVAAGDYAAFQAAARGGHLAVVNRLVELVPEDRVQAMVAAENYAAFREAAGGGHLAVVNRLLQFNTVFAYVEMHDWEYGSRYVYPFVQAQLAVLQERRTTFEATHPQGVFDVTEPEDAKRCFYMLRNLIRRNNPALEGDIQFLINLPSVKALLHTEVTPGQSNELLRLAMNQGNAFAANVLLNVPAVHTRAVQDDFYRAEARGGLDLANLARDRESSMTALTSGEQKRLAAVTERYQPMLQASGGVSGVMLSLKKALQARYEAHPATFETGDGRIITLPFPWEAWDAERKNYSADTQEHALQAYYKHQDHTAWRYLLKPNPWMDRDAPYVNRDTHGGWSTFEEYQPLIALLFLAAKDEDVAPCDGYDLATRVEHFVDELALIGRAHNWDESRTSTNAAGGSISEEYDDLEGDKPSCYSGVKRRLFQAVQGHPLLKMLTMDTVKQELRECMRAHFKACIEQQPEQAVAWKQAWTDAINEGKMSDVLSELNVSEEAEKNLLEGLSQKYPGQFDEGFKAYIQERLHNQHIPQHAMAFGGETDLAGLLEPCIRKTPLTKEEVRELRLAALDRASQPSQSSQSSPPKDEDPPSAKPPGGNLG